MLIILSMLTAQLCVNRQEIDNYLTISFKSTPIKKKKQGRFFDLPCLFSVNYTILIWRIKP